MSHLLITIGKMDKYVFAYILQQLKTDFLDPYSYIHGHIVLIKG